jgi:hypothetical protein
MSSPETCPKCSSPVPAGALDCPACGIVFAKYRGPDAPPPPAASGDLFNPYAPPQSELGPGPAGSASSVDDKLVGIRGWLVLPAIGLVVGPVLGVVSVIIMVGLFDQIAAQGFGGVLTLEILVQLGLAVFLIYAAIRFFGKKSNAPATMIVLLLANVVATAVLFMVEQGAGASQFAAENGKALARTVIGAAIWIPYFRSSRRVKATFVN